MMIKYSDNKNYLRIFRSDNVKRSRLNLFKATSMVISVLGVIMVVVTIIIFAYLGFQALSSTISSDVSTGNAYDKVAVLKAEYNALQAEFSSVKRTVDKKNNKNLTTDYLNAEMELIAAQSDISDAESAISSKKSPEEIQNRIDIANAQLVKAKESLAQLRTQL